MTVIIKRIPKEPETYVVWLVPESVGDIASGFVRGAFRATAEDLASLPGSAATQREKDRARIAELEGQRDKAEAALEAVRVELCKAGAAECPYAEGVAQLVKERDKARAALAVYR